MNKQDNEEQVILNTVEKQLVWLNYEALVELEIMVENELLSRPEAKY